MTDPILEAVNAITRMSKGFSGVGKSDVVSKDDSVSGDKLAQKLPKSKPISGSANGVSSGSRPQGNRIRSFRETYFDEDALANASGQNIRLFDPILGAVRRKRRRNLFRMSQDID